MWYENGVKKSNLCRLAFALTVSMKFEHDQEDTLCFPKPRALSVLQTKSSFHNVELFLRNTTAVSLNVAELSCQTSVQHLKAHSAEIRLL